jgi:O-antigen ligase
MSLHKQNIKLIIPCLLLVTIAWLFYFAFLDISASGLFLAALVSYIFIISLFYPKLGFFALIFIRPILDIIRFEKIIQIGSFSLNVAALTGVFIIIIALVNLWQKGEEIKKNKLLLPWIIFLLLSTVSIAFSTNLNSSLEELARLLSIFSAFILGLLLIKNKHDLTSLIKIIIYSAIIPAIVALKQLITNTGLTDDGATNRLLGTFAHPNMLGFFLAFISALALFAYLKNRKEKIETNFFGFIFLVATAVLALTFARGAWIAFFIFIIIVGLVKFRLVLLSMVLVFCALYLTVIPIQTRVDSVFEHRSYSSIAWRYQLWQDEYTYFKKEPLTGYGLGTASQIIQKNRGEKLGSSEPHNDYLKIAIESGFLALLAYLWLVIRTNVFLLKAYQKSQTNKLKFFHFFLLASLVGIFIMSFGDNVLNDTALQWSLWALLAGVIKVNK